MKYSSLTWIQIFTRMAEATNSQTDEDMKTDDEIIILDPNEEVDDQVTTASTDYARNIPDPSKSLGPGYSGHFDKDGIKMDNKGSYLIFHFPKPNSEKIPKMPILNPDEI